MYVGPNFSSATLNPNEVATFTFALDSNPFDGMCVNTLKSSSGQEMDSLTIFW
jgi:hypothetical protein